MSVIHEGLLNKRGRSIAGISIWKWRYFTLTPTTLEWSDKLKRKQSRVCVAVGDIVSVTRIASKRFHRHRFALQFINSPAFECSALTELDMLQWLDKLNTLIQHNNIDRNIQRRLWQNRIAAKNHKKLHHTNDVVVRSTSSSDSEHDSELRDVVQFDNFDTVHNRHKHQYYTNNRSHCLPLTTDSIKQNRLLNSTTHGSSTHSATIVDSRQLLQSLLYFIAMLLILFLILLYNSSYRTIHELTTYSNHTITTLVHHSPIECIVQPIVPLYRLLRVPLLLSTAVLSLVNITNTKSHTAALFSIVEALILFDTIPTIK